MSNLIAADALARLKREAASHPYPMIFATIIGAQVDGFL